MRQKRRQKALQNQQKTKKTKKKPDDGNEQDNIEDVAQEEMTNCVIPYDKL